VFHRYVTASSGRKIDFDRASFLMDKELLQRARDEARQHMDKVNDPVGFDMLRVQRAVEHGETPLMNLPLTERHMLDFIWARYCHFHRNKYRSSFEPDVSSSWDA